MPLPSSILARGLTAEPSVAASGMRAAPSPVVAVVALLASLMGVVAVMGGDSRWLAAAGAEMVRRRELLSAVPYADAPSTGWHNVPALAELLAYAAAVLSSHGLLVLHIAAVTAGLLVLARDAAAGGAARSSTALVLAALACGAFTSLFVVRLQLFSLLLFPVLALLLRSDARWPSSRVWWVPAVLALWGNLHGAVLLGLAVTLTYLIFSRAQHQLRSTLCVAAASCAALFATPVGLDTVYYYTGVAANEAARQHVGLWARLSPSNPFDLVLVVVALVFVLLFLRTRPALWERLAALGLGVAVLLAARNGVWLLLFLAPLAARGFRAPAWRHRRAVTAVVAVSALAFGVLAVVRGPAEFGASPRLIALTVDASARCGVYAEESLGEQVVEAGGRVRITNPIDTFSAEEQRRYIGWMQTGDLELVPSDVSALLVRPGGAADRALRRDPSYSVAAQDRTAVLHVGPTTCLP